MAEVVDLVVDQGALFRYTVNVLFEGVSIPITGWLAHLEIRETRRLDSPVLYSQSSAGQLIVVGDPPQIHIDIPGAVTKLWEWDHAQYDLTLVDLAGESHRVLQGAVRVSHTVTA